VILTMLVDAGGIELVEKNGAGQNRPLKGFNP
jgi:hypothetical protein